jgi:hypothetical protein
MSNKGSKEGTPLLEHSVQAASRWTFLSKKNVRWLSVAEAA